MKTLKLLFIALLIGTATQAQEYKIEGNELVRVDSIKKSKTTIKTGYTTTIKGKVHPVYKGTKGGLFIWRTSKKTGKKYKQYLKVKK